MFHTNEPDLATPIRALLEQVVGLVSKGYYYYIVTLAPEDDTEAFDLEIKNWIEQLKLSTALTHPHDDVQYLSFNRFRLLIATDGLHDVFVADRLRVKDIRNQPLPCCGYQVRCDKVNSSYCVAVVGPSGKTLDFSRRCTVI